MSLDNIIHYIAYPQEVPGLDIFLTTILLFTVLYFGLSTSGVMKKKQNIVVSLILSAMVVFPHITDSYPPCYDLVVIINNAMPQFGLMVIAFVTFLIILAAVGIRGGYSNFVMGLIAVAVFVKVGYTFIASTSGYYRQMCPGPPQLSEAFGDLISAGWLGVIIVVVVAYLLIRYVASRRGR